MKNEIKLEDKLEDKGIRSLLEGKYTGYDFLLIEDEDEDDAVKILYRKKNGHKEREASNRNIEKMCYELCEEKGFSEDEMLRIYICYDYYDEMGEYLLSIMKEIESLLFNELGDSINIENDMMPCKNINNDVVHDGFGRMLQIHNVNAA